MRNHVILILFTSLAFVMGACTITYEFGPFMGKVVDAETGEPIEGAAVLIGFHTKSGSMGGTVYSFADAIETLTDVEGNFQFSPKRITQFKMMSLWDKRYQILIFKPGYAAYPGNMRLSHSSLEKEHSMFIPEDQHVMYFLPKLTTLEEREKNHHWINTPGGITNDKMPDFRKLLDKDSDAIFRMKTEKENERINN